MLTEKQIADACHKAYLKAGNNVYFGNGFEAGVRFAIEQENKLLLFINKCTNGGCIVSTGMLNSNAIVFKSVSGDVYVTSDGFGFAYLTPEDLSKIEDITIRWTVQYVKNEICVTSVDDIKEINVINFFQDKRTETLR
jgi:hypothetical protein